MQKGRYRSFKLSRNFTLVMSSKGHVALRENPLAVRASVSGHRYCGSGDIMALVCHMFL